MSNVDDETGFPIHLLFPVTIDGEGPAGHLDFDHYTCWCSDRECKYFVTIPND